MPHERTHSIKICWDWVCEPLSICAAVNSPSDLIVMPLSFKVACTSFWASVVFACGLMKTKAEFFSSPHCDTGNANVAEMGSQESGTED